MLSVDHGRDKMTSWYAISHGVVFGILCQCDDHEKNEHHVQRRQSPLFGNFHGSSRELFGVDRKKP